MLEISIEITGHTDMRCRIHTVCSKAYLDESIRSQTEVILCRSTDDCFRIKNHDTVMRLSDAKLVLGTDHSE